MKMIVSKIFFYLLYLYEQLNFLKPFIFGLEFTLSLEKWYSKKIEILLIPNFSLRENLGNAVTK